MTNIWKKDTYISPYYGYIVSSYIREYDIQKANISILKKYGLISHEEYMHYYNMDRDTRQISIGCLSRDRKDVKEALKHGFVESRRLFFEANNIQESEVLSINKDAIFLVNKVATNLEFGGVNFVNKNTFTSYYPLKNNLKLYYFLDTVHGVDLLAVKGIDNKILHVHEPFIMDFFKYIFELAQTSTIEEVISTLSGFYNQYINRELDIGYYREFNPGSKFLLQAGGLFTWYLDFTGEENKKYLNISCNRELLESLHSIFSSIYFSTNKRR